MVIGCFFFFKQKTAYDMRISDWSSDVCSSDLAASAVGLAASAIGTGLMGFVGQAGAAQEEAVEMPGTIAEAGTMIRSGRISSERLTRAYLAAIEQDRKSVV